MNANQLSQLTYEDWKGIGLIGGFILCSKLVSRFWRQDLSDIHVDILVCFVVCGTLWLGKRWWKREIVNYGRHEEVN